MLEHSSIFGGHPDAIYFGLFGAILIVLQVSSFAMRNVRKRKAWDALLKNPTLENFDTVKPDPLLDRDKNRWSPDVFAHRRYLILFLGLGGLGKALAICHQRFRLIFTGKEVIADSIEYRSTDAGAQVKYTFKVDRQSFYSSEYKCDQDGCKYVPDFVTTAEVNRDISNTNQSNMIRYLPNNPEINGPMAIGAAPELLFALIVGAVSIGIYAAWKYLR